MDSNIPVEHWEEYFKGYKEAAESTIAVLKKSNRDMHEERVHLAKILWALINRLGGKVTLSPDEMPLGTGYEVHSIVDPANKTITYQTHGPRES